MKSILENRPALAAEAPSPEATPSVLYPVEVLEYTEGDRAEPRISKTYELSPMDDPALIPTGDFERSGCLYTLCWILSRRTRRRRTASITPRP
mgnify:CR=1 FL=1